MLHPQVKDCKGVFELPCPGGLLVLFLLSLGALRRRRWHLLLPPGEPVAHLECCPPCPNGREDSLLKEFFLEGQCPLCADDEVE